MKALAQSTLIYGVGHIISRMQVFLLIPFLTHKLSPTDYGLLETLGSAGVLLTSLSLLNLDSAISAHISNAQSNEEKRSLSKSVTTMFAFTSSIFLTLILLFSDFFSIMILGSEELGSLLIITTFASLANAFNSYNLVLTRFLFKTWTFSIFVTINSFLVFLVTAILLYVFEMGIMGAVLGNAIAQLTTSLIIGFHHRQYLGFSLTETKLHIDRNLKVIVPLIPFTLSSWALSLFDRTLLSSLKSFTDVGIYGLSSKIASLFNSFSGPFQLAWLPFAMKELNQGEPKKVFPKTLSFYLLFSGIILVFIGSYSNTLTTLLSPEAYQNSAQFVPILILCNILNSIYFFALPIFLFKKTMINSTASAFSGAIVNIITNLLLTPVYGLWGIMIANLLGYSTLAISAIHRSQKNIPIPYKGKEYLLILIYQLSFSILTSLYSATVSKHEHLFFALGIWTYLVLFTRFDLLSTRDFQKVTRYASSFFQKSIRSESRSQLSNKKCYNLLLVTNFFPPRIHTACQRNLAYIKYLDQKKFKITVLTSFDTHRNVQELEKNYNIKIIQVAPKKIVASFNTQKPHGWLIHRFRSAMNKIFNYLTIDGPNAFSREAYKKALKITSDEHFDILLTSFAPVSALKIGLQIKSAHPDIFWISDMRDEMSQNPEIPFWQKIYLMYIELRMLDAANLVTSVSKPILDDFLLNAPHIQNEKLFEVRNGFDFEIEKNVLSKIDCTKIKICFMGTLYGSIKPHSLFLALEKIRKVLIHLPFELHFYGNSGGVVIPDTLKDMVIFHRAIPYHQVSAVLTTMDVFLVIHPQSSNRGNFTSKIFDYLAINRPILALVDPTDVAATLIQDTNSGYISANEDIEGIESVLVRMMSDFQNNTLPNRNWDLIQKCSRLYQVKRLEQRLLNNENIDSL